MTEVPTSTLLTVAHLQAAAILDTLIPARNAVVAAPQRIVRHLTRAIIGRALECYMRIGYSIEDARDLLWRTDPPEQVRKILERELPHVEVIPGRPLIQVLAQDPLAE